MYTWQGGRGRGKNAQSQDGGYWSYWSGSQQAWNQQKNKNQQSQQNFPHYDSREVDKNAQNGDLIQVLEIRPPAVGTDATLVRDLQQLVNQARKSEQKLKKLQGDRARREAQWAQYEKDIKESFLQERQRYQDALVSLDEEIVKATSLQNEARARVRSAAAGDGVQSHAAGSSAPDPWQEQVTAWELDYQANDASFGETLRRAMQGPWHDVRSHCCECCARDPCTMWDLPEDPPCNPCCAQGDSTTPAYRFQVAAFPAAQASCSGRQEPICCHGPVYPSCQCDFPVEHRQSWQWRSTTHSTATYSAQGWCPPTCPLHFRHASPAQDRDALVTSKRASAMAQVMEGISSGPPRTNAGLLDDDGGGPAVTIPLPQDPLMDSME